MWTANQGKFGILTRGTGVGEFVPITVGNSTITNAIDSITLKTPVLKFTFGSVTTAISSFALATGFSLWSANQLVTADVLKAVFLTVTDASNTYATIASLSDYLLSSTAASTYQTQAGMSSYLTTSAASNTYLSKTDASNTYQTQAGMSSYLTTTAASNTYQTQAGMSNYLTTTTAASTYQTQAGMSNYLTSSDASNDYVPIRAGSSTITNSSSNIELKTSTLKFTFGSTSTSITSFATDFDTWTNSQIATALQIKNAILNVTAGRVIHKANITNPKIGFWCAAINSVVSSSDLTPNVKSHHILDDTLLGIILDNEHYISQGPVNVVMSSYSITYDAGTLLRPSTDGAMSVPDDDKLNMAKWGVPHVRVTCNNTSIVPQIDGQKCYACFIS
jgi:hypothetical protein